MANLLGVSASTINRTIDKDLDMKKATKGKVHALSDRTVAQRMARALPLYNYIRGRRLKYIVSIDEAWAYSSYCNGQRKIFYRFRGDTTQKKWINFCKKNGANGVMFACGISWRGPTDIYFVEPGAKVNADYYFKYVLRPIVEKDIPRLYPGEVAKVILHQDSAPAHTAKKTIAYLKSTGIQFIRKEDWLSNAPDAAPMDYGINGNFKRMLFNPVAKNLRGLKLVLRRVWRAFPLPLIRKTLLAWPGRLLKIHEANGYQIEYLL